jgi:SAM-dependent methyltransferase
MNDNVDKKRSWSRGELEWLTACPCCGKPVLPSHRHYMRQDDQGYMPDIWSQNLCSHCASIYLNPRPDKASLSMAYTDYYTHSKHAEERALIAPGPFWALLRDYLAWRFGMTTPAPTLYGGRWLVRALPPLQQKLDRFGRHLDRTKFPQGGRVLDIGCGNGTFLRLVQAMGWQAQGLEPDAKSSAICQKYGLEVTHGNLAQFCAQSHAAFDAITLNQVIEHVIDPQTVLSQCFQLLRPGGMIWLGLPNPKSIGLKLFRESWGPLHPPQHLQIPTQHVLKHWLSEAGFLKIETPCLGMHAKADWRESLPIALRDHMPLPSPVTRSLCRIGADILSLMSTRWAEESVVLAHRPNTA